MATGDLALLTILEKLPPYGQLFSIWQKFVEIRLENSAEINFENFAEICLENSAEINLENFV